MAERREKGEKNGEGSCLPVSEGLWCCGGVEIGKGMDWQRNGLKSDIRKAVILAGIA